MQLIKKIFFSILITTAVAINQNCPCPQNSVCQSNNMCACNAGFVGNCSTPAIPLGTTSQLVSLKQGVTTLFQINPLQLGHYIEF